MESFIAVVELSPDEIAFDIASKYDVPTSLWCFVVVYPSFSLSNYEINNILILLIQLILIEYK